jgi:hypothetical protein
MQWFSFALREAKVANVSLVRLLQINPDGYGPDRPAADVA